MGKSTLINRYLGEERLLTSDEAGTTRDSIQVPFSHEGRDFVLVDTAGIRRKARVDEMIERFSIVKSLQALEEADAVLVLLDARAERHGAGCLADRPRAGAGQGAGDRHQQVGSPADGPAREGAQRPGPRGCRSSISPTSTTSPRCTARPSTTCSRAAGARRRRRCADLPTPDLNRVLKDAIQAYPTPVAHRSRIKLTYAHQGGRRPPLIVIHGNQTAALPESYRRYLVGCFRKAFRLRGHADPHRAAHRARTRSPAGATS